MRKKSKSSNLFDLIKSFNQAEKAYFKKYSKQYGFDSTKSYFELFSLIDNQSRYDEEIIIAKLSNKKFAENISVGKNYLYNLLLKSLRNYHSGKMVVIEIRELYMDAWILLDRGLNKQAFKILTKAKKIAKKYHLKHELLSILLFQRILIRNFTEKKMLESLKKYQKEYEVNFQDLVKDEQLRITYENVFLINQKAETITDELENAFEKFDAISMQEPSPSKLNYEWKSLNCFLKAFYYKQKKDFISAANQYKDLDIYFDNNPHLKKEYPMRYIIVLGNYSGILLNLDKLDEIPSIIQKLENIKPRNNQIQITLLNCIYYTKIIYYLGIKEYDKIINLAPDIWNFLNDFNQHVPKGRKKTLYYNCARAFFMCGNFEKSLDWLEFLLAEFKTKFRPDITFFARRLAILNHFELNAEFHVEYRIRNMKYRYRNSPFKHFILPVLTTLNTIINSPSSKEKKLLNNLYNEIKDNPQMTDIKEWLEVRKTWKNR